VSVAKPFRNLIEDIGENAADIIIVVIGIIILYALITIGTKLWGGLSSLFSGIQGLSLGGGSGPSGGGGSIGGGGQGGVNPYNPGGGGTESILNISRFPQFQVNTALLSGGAQSYPAANLNQNPYVPLPYQAPVANVPTGLLSSLGISPNAPGNLYFGNRNVTPYTPIVYYNTPPSNPAQSQMGGVYTPISLQGPFVPKGPTPSGAHIQ